MSQTHFVIESGGKQYRAAIGDKLKLEKLPAEVGDIVEFDHVLMRTAGEIVEIGSPYLEGNPVRGEVLSHGRGEKIMIVKMNRRKHHRKQMGHRQAYTEIRLVEGVSHGT
jgi:large subunit ribosomal protein L21